MQKLDAERVKGKSKGKEILYRFNGEVVEGEPVPEPRDPRRDASVKRLPCLRSQRTEYVEVKYEVRRTCAHAQTDFPHVPAYSTTRTRRAQHRRALSWSSTSLR